MPYPWQITSDYLTSGNQNAKNIIDKINNWIISNSTQNTNNIFAGYQLNETPKANYNYIYFSGAFAVSAMITNNQT